MRDAFLAAPFEEHGWSRALDGLAERTNSARAQLLAMGGADAVRFNHVTGLSDGDLQRYAQEFVEIEAYRPDVNWRIAASRSINEQILDERHYAAFRHDPAYALYEDHVARWGGEHGCQTNLMQASETFFGLALLRPSDNGPTSAENRALFGAVAPFVMAAIRLQLALEHNTGALLAAGLESIDVAAFVCDMGGRVIAKTSAAEALLQGGRGFVERWGMLSATNRRTSDRLAHAIDAVLRGDDERAAVERFWIADPASPSPGLVCEIFRLPTRHGCFGFAPHALVIVREPTAIPNVKGMLLSEAFHLTTAEAEIALLLAEGRSREEIALIRQVSAQTIAAQLKSIYRKCDSAREGETVALINHILR